MEVYHSVRSARGISDYFRLLRYWASLPPPVLAVRVAAAADEEKLAPLPEVTVTAPRPVIPPEKKFVPYFGNPRVEEDKWPDIPCSDSRVGVAVAGTCKNRHTAGVRAGTVT